MPTGSSFCTFEDVLIHRWVFHAILGQRHSIQAAVEKREVFALRVPAFELANHPSINHPSVCIALKDISGAVRSTQEPLPAELHRLADHFLILAATCASVAPPKKVSFCLCCVLFTICATALSIAAGVHQPSNHIITHLGRSASPSSVNG